MDASKSAMVQFSLYDYGSRGSRSHPRDIYLNVIPKPARAVWIPQSMADAIWVLYEFNSTADRDEFLKNRPPEFDAANVGIEDQSFYDHEVGQS